MQYLFENIVIYFESSILLGIINTDAFKLRRITYFKKMLLQFPKKEMKQNFEK